VTEAATTLISFRKNLLFVLVIVNGRKRFKMKIKMKQELLHGALMTNLKQRNLKDTIK